MRDGDPNIHALNLYYPEHCAKAKEILSRGETLTSVAAELDVDRRTIETWRKKYPEFDWACTTGQAKGLSYWEKVGAQNLDNQKYNTTMYIFKLKSQYQVRDNDPPQQAQGLNVHAVLGIDGDKHESLKSHILNQAAVRGEIDE